MAAITSTKSGLFSDTTVWSTGTVPTSLDTVTIAAGHTVTIDGTYTVGTDTATAAMNLAATAVLRHSTTVNSELILRGNFTAASTSEYVMGETGAAIPDGVTAILTLNSSASPAYNKYSAPTGTFVPFVRIRSGHVRTRKTTLTSAISAGTNTLNVANSTNWKVGDVIVACGTDGTTTKDEVAVITALGSPITVNVGVGGGNWVNAHASGGHVVNLSSNCIIRDANTNQGTGFVLADILRAGTNGARANKFECVGALFENIGNFGCLSIIPDVSKTDQYSASLHPMREIADNVTTVRWLPSRSSSGAVVVASGNSANSGGIVSGGVDLTLRPITRHVAIGPAAINNTPPGLALSGAGGYFLDCISIGGQCMGTTGGSYGGKYENCDTYNPPANGGHFAVNSGAHNIVFTGTKLHGGTSVHSAYGAGNQAGWTFRATNCQFGTATEAITNFFLNSNGTSGFVRGVLIDCTTNYTLDSSFTTQRGDWLSSLAFGGASGTQIVFTSRGNIERDATTFRTAAPALRMTPNAGVTTSTPLQQTFQIPAFNGVPLVVYGYIRKNAGYGSANRPTITISGAGITPQTYTMPDTTDTWELWSFAVTQSSGVNTTLTVTVSVPNTTGSCWLDDVSVTLASAVSTGAMDFFVDGSPVNFILSNFTSAGDVWSSPSRTLTSSLDPTAAAIATQVWSEVLETGFTASRELRIAAAAVAGKITGGPGSPVFRNLADTQNQITGTADQDGNRSSVTYGS